MTSWVLVLSDRNGNALAELATAQTPQIRRQRNRPREISLAISHTDDAARLLLEAMSNGVPTLKGYRIEDGSKVLRFNGYLAPFDEQLEDTTVLSPTFRDPFGRLLGDGNDRGRFLTGQQAFSATDAGLIAKSLIDTANAAGGTGLSTSTATIAASKTRDRTYEVGQNIGQAVVDLTEVLDGFDFDVVPVDSGSTLGDLEVYARMGQDRAAAVFEYGPGTLANVRSVKRTTSHPINLVLGTGGNGLTTTKSDAASIAVHGEWPAYFQDTDVTEQATLDDKASAMLRPNWVRVIEFTPDVALSPQPFVDFDVGDTVRFRGRRDAFVEDLQVRVNALTITLDESGHESGLQIEIEQELS